VNAVNDARPLASLSIATTGATRYYSVSDERDPVRRTYTSGGTAGDTSQQSHYGEYKLINGAAPAYTFFGPRGTKQSEVFPVRSLTVTENDVALPAERGNLEYAGLALVYEGNRVKSALLGRDLNPLGRGDGVHYVAGAMKILAATRNVGAWFARSGSGNSVNNCGQCGGNGGSFSWQGGGGAFSSDKYERPPGDPEDVPKGPPKSGPCQHAKGAGLLENTWDWQDRRHLKKPKNPWDSNLRFLIAVACCGNLSACCMAGGLPIMRCKKLGTSTGPYNYDWCCNPNDCGDTSFYKEKVYSADPRCGFLGAPPFWMLPASDPTLCREKATDPNRTCSDWCACWEACSPPDLTGEMHKDKLIEACNEFCIAEGEEGKPPDPPYHCPVWPIIEV
jgi:hypothetical protein